MIAGRLNGLGLKLRQEFHNDQDNNNDGEHIDESPCVPEAGNGRLTEKTEQPVNRQYQDDQLKQGNLLFRRTGVAPSGPKNGRMEVI